MKRLACLAAIVIALGGCGGEEKESARAIEDAVAATAKQGPLRIDQHVTIQAGPNESVDMNLSGVADSDSHTLRVTMNSDWIGPGAPKGTAKQLEGLDGEMAQKGELVYMKLAALGRQLGAPGEWIVLDPSDPVTRDSGFTGSSGFGTIDPTVPFDHLRAGEDVERVGEDEWGTRYRMTIDYGEYLKLADPERRDAMAKEIEKLEDGTGTDRHPLDAWIEDGKITRIDGAIRHEDGPDVITYTIGLETSPEPPAIPKHAITFQEVLKR